VHEYLDLYVEVKDSNVSDLINSPFGGRYCGPIAPRRRISLYRTLALGYFTDKNATYPELFGGTYAFINDCEFTICFFLIPVCFLREQRETFPSLLNSFN